MAKIIIDPKIMLGKPVVAGTRITVEQILRLLAQKLTLKDILADFPQLKETDIRAAVEYAAKKVARVEPQAVSYLNKSGISSGVLAIIAPASLSAFIFDL